MSTTNFDYDDAKQTLVKIEQVTDKLIKVLNDMNNVIEDNINDSSVWSGDAANSYKRKWEQFYNDSKNSFINSFESQSVNLKTALDNYKVWEQGNEK